MTLSQWDDARLITYRRTVHLRNGDRKNAKKNFISRMLQPAIIVGANNVPGIFIGIIGGATPFF